jgi:hypothetical protein
MWMKNGERYYTRWLPKDHAFVGKPLAHNRARRFCKQTKQPVCNAYQARVSSETPRFAAMTVVAATVRFNALAIFSTPTFCLANPFSL